MRLVEGKICSVNVRNLIPLRHAIDCIAPGSSRSYTIYGHANRWQGCRKMANPEQFRGWLLKWTNYIKGYQRRWFVLSNGLLSYYRYVCGNYNVGSSCCTIYGNLQYVASLAASPSFSIWNLEGNISWHAVSISKWVLAIQ